MPFIGYNHLNYSHLNYSDLRYLSLNGHGFATKWRFFEILDKECFCISAHCLRYYHGYSMSITPDTLSADAYDF